MLATHEKKYIRRNEFIVHDEPPFDVAVIGAGASGALMAAQFRRNAPVQARLALIGPDQHAGRGIAYETHYRSHLLNVRAANMSAFPDDMDHFLRWLQYRDPDAHSKTFAPRSVYGDYLADLLKVPAKGFAGIIRFTGTAVELSKSNGLWSVYLDDGSSILARTVVLALGNQLPADPLQLQSKHMPSYWRNPWAPDVALGLPAHAPVLLIGTGQTAVDVVMSLREGGHRGPIYAISRHGRLSQEHVDFSRRPTVKLPAGLNSPVAALRWLRKEIEIARREGYDWRAVLDGIRPHTAAIWRSWSVPQRASFLRHARNLWDIHRHRVAPVIYRQIQELIAQNVLSIHCGKIDSMYAIAQGIAVNWQPTGGRELKTLQVARVINCTGPDRDYAQTNQPLIVSLRRSGWLTPDALRLGIETNNDGQLLDPDGSPVPGLFALGPLRIPALWESIAIPEIRIQAAALVKLLIASSVNAPISAY